MIYGKDVCNSHFHSLLHHLLPMIETACPIKLSSDTSVKSETHEMKSCSVRRQDQTVHDFFQVHYPSPRIEMSSLGRTAGTKIGESGNTVYIQH